MVKNMNQLSFLETDHRHMRLRSRHFSYPIHIKEPS